MVDSNNQEMKMIISLSLILNYVHYSHPNYTKIIMIQVHVWVRMLHIWQKYTFIITAMVRSLFKKNSRNVSQNVQKRRSEGKGNYIYENKWKENVKLKHKKQTQFWYKNLQIDWETAEFLVFRSNIIVIIPIFKKETS